MTEIFLRNPVSGCSLVTEGALFYLHKGDRSFISHGGDRYFIFRKAIAVLFPREAKSKGGIAPLTAILFARKAIDRFLVAKNKPGFLD